MAPLYPTLSSDWFDSSRITPNDGSTFTPIYPYYTPTTNTPAIEVSNTKAERPSKFSILNLQHVHNLREQGVEGTKNYQESVTPTSKGNTSGNYTTITGATSGAINLEVRGESTDSETVVMSSPIIETPSYEVQNPISNPQLDSPLSHQHMQKP